MVYDRQRWPHRQAIGANLLEFRHVLRPVDFPRLLVLRSLRRSAAAHPASARTHQPTAQPKTVELRVFDPSLIDKSIDPCDNFYRFSCNGWFKRNPLPPDQTSYGRFTELFELNRLHLKEILEAAAEALSIRTPNEQKIGDEYASCMDTAAIDKLGLTPLQPELDRIAALKSTGRIARATRRTCNASASTHFSIWAPTRTSPMPTR